jgi:hypothetical protein
VPQTPDSFPGIREDEGLKLIDDGYGLPGTAGEYRYSDGYFYAMDAYGSFNMRTNVHPHISSHIGGTDSFYVISPNTPTAYEDENDGYLVGWRWIDTTDGYEYVLVDSSVGAAVWRNTTVGATSSVESVFFDAFDSSGGTDISSGWTDVPLDTERIEDSAFSHTGSSAEVTINTSGTYLVFARVGTDISSGTNRSESEMRVMLDSGSGYNEVPGSRGLMYNRTLGQGGTHASAVLVLSLNVGNKLKIQAQRISGGSTVVLEPNNSGLVIASSTGCGGGGSGTDELVKISANDTTAGYLEDKVVGDGYVSVTTLNDGGDEEIQISVNLDGYVGEYEHKTLRHLIHFIDEGPGGGFASGAYRETLPAGSPFPTSIIWWESSAKLQKIVELIITRSGVFPITEEWKMYDINGITVLETITDSISYSGAFEISRTRTIS